MTTNGTRWAFTLVIAAAALAANGCGGGGGGGAGSTAPDPATLSSISTAQTQINAGIMNTVVSGFMVDAANYATDHSETVPTAPSDPNPPDTATALVAVRMAGADTGGCGEWAGPSADGSYWRSCKWGYGDDSLTEHVKTLAAPQVGWDYWSEIHMGDAASGQTTFTTRAQLVKGDHGLLSGYYDFKVDSSGGEVNSWGQWTFKFANVDPASGAGHYEWWGGGDVNSLMPYGLFMTIDATVKDSQWLHAVIKWGEGADAFEWEFDCMYHPISLPELPDLPSR